MRLVYKYCKRQFQFSLISPKNLHIGFTLELPSKTIVHEIIFYYYQLTGLAYNSKFIALKTLVDLKDRIPSPGSGVGFGGVIFVELLLELPLIIL